MSEFEQELREGLRRVEAPEGFAERVLARASTQQESHSTRAPWWRAVAAAFLLGALFGGWLMHQERVDRQEALETREQFVEAMRITNRSLEHAGQKIEQAGEKGRVQ